MKKKFKFYRDYNFKSLEIKESPEDQLTCIRNHERQSESTRKK